MHVRTILLVGVMAALTGCASSRPNDGSELTAGPRLTTQTLVGADGGAVGMNMVNDATAVGTLVQGTADVTWSALQSVYASLDIPLSFRDATRRTLGNEAFRTRRRVGSVPMIRALNCGGESGMPNAETYDITLQLSSSVTPTGDGNARLQTLVQASARRPSGGSMNDVRCTSLGGLENKIAEMVQAIVAGK